MQLLHIHKSFPSFKHIVLPIHKKKQKSKPYFLSRWGLARLGAEGPEEGKLHHLKLCFPPDSKDSWVLFCDRFGTSWLPIIFHLQNEEQCQHQDSCIFKILQWKMNKRCWLPDWHREVGLVTELINSGRMAHCNPVQGRADSSKFSSMAKALRDEKSLYWKNIFHLFRAGFNFKMDGALILKEGNTKKIFTQAFTGTLGAKFCCCCATQAAWGRKIN